MVYMNAKERMLNAYRGKEWDTVPVAPEFWFYYPAKVLGVTVAEFQREYPHWFGMKKCFEKYGCEGWGIAGASQNHPDIHVESDYQRIAEHSYRETQRLHYGEKTYERTNLYTDDIPFWIEEPPVKNAGELNHFLSVSLSEKMEFDFKDAVHAYNEVGNAFLLEFDLGLSFFDYFEDIMGFEEAALFFMREEEAVIQKYFDQYTAHKLALLNGAVQNAPYESYYIGCSSSCLALLGADLWRKWDKPYEKIMTDACHKHGKLVHNHNHGKCMAIVPDFVEIGFDCVCPFERDPGDVNGVEGLRKVKELLDDKVTFNGNVHTVKALINGTPQMVRQQVREIKEVFHGSSWRYIIGTGDQVGAETPEENLYAMIEEARLDI